MQSLNGGLLIQGAKQMNGPALPLFTPINSDRNTHHEFGDICIDVEGSIGEGFTGFGNVNFLFLSRDRSSNGDWEDQQQMRDCRNECCFRSLAKSFV